MSAAVGVLFREWMAFRRALGRAGVIRFLVVYCGVLGYFIPSRFSDPSAAAVVFALMPLYIAGPLAIDCFAGERERKTLETLLCSPAGSGSIVAGKVLFPVIASLSVTWLSFVVFAGISLARSAPLPPLPAAALAIALGICLSLASSAAGLHVSLGARSSRGAMQWYSITLLAVSVGLPMALKSALGILSPAAREATASLFAGGWLSAGSAVVAGAFLALDAGLLLILRRRAANLRVMNTRSGEA